MDIRNYVDVKQFGEKNKTKQNKTKLKNPKTQVLMLANG